ncbi:MAG: 4Fe-4S binding protein [Desulfarculaceae bacterium]
MILEPDKCNACGLCARECPLQAITMVDDLPEFGGKCVTCGLCLGLCPTGAITAPPPQETGPGAAVCDHCPVACRIPADSLGACQRYRNQDGEVVHARPLLLPPEKDLKTVYREALLNQPVITGVGAGGTYPDYIPAPLAAHKTVDGVDVVTVVTESPLTYSGLLVKIDSDRFIGPETAPVKYRGAAVGHVTTEHYGSKMISLGGINVMKSKNRLKAVRLIVDAANGETFKLQVEGGASLELRVGEAPIIDGQPSQDMKVACGAAIMGIFGQKLKDLADEIIVLDSDITGLFSEGHVGHILGFEWRGLRPKGRYTTPGRYFGNPGKGWGGTDISDPVQAFEVEDPEKVWPGMKLLILEVTGNQAALLEADENKRFHLVDLPQEAAEMRELIARNKEPALTSAMYMGGCGGSARAGVSGNPVKLNRAVHSGRARLTVGGVPAYVMPGGGINFLVDVGAMQWRSFCWTPAPAVVAPIEYTMEKETYYSLGGHKRKLRLLSEIAEEREVREWGGPGSGE